MRCKYCYVYEHQDQSWRDQPALMSETVMRMAAQRIAEHWQGSEERLPVRLVLHGGEPLLLGKAKMRRLITIFREVFDPLGINYTFLMQSNGLLFDPEWVELLHELRVGVGISLDGPRAFHDRHRLDVQGMGTHRRVTDTIELLQGTAAGQAIFGGTISVLNRDCPPEELYAFLRGLGLQKLGFLLPDHNFEHPPAGWRGPEQPTGFGEYLIRLFDCWIQEADPQVSIGFFEMPMRLLRGSSLRWGDEYWGLTPAMLAVIETDGSIEPVDYLKVCAAGITKTSLNVATDPIAALLATSILQPLVEREAHLAPVCQSCRLKSVCGGGLLAHRYHQGHFSNPSVYCHDIQQLLDHMAATITLFELAASWQKKADAVSIVN
ncbi:radical SAM protein [Gloeobacter kilaueensis]